MDAAADGWHMTLLFVWDKSILHCLIEANLELLVRPPVLALKVVAVTSNSDAVPGGKLFQGMRADLVEQPIELATP